jgi:O-antigen/teichoic acid export membrane protein
MLKKMFLSEFNKNSIILLAGTALSQALPLIFSPLLARLYSPNEFGAFSLFLSICIVLGTISSAKLDLALYTSKSRETAIITSLSGIAFCFAFSTFILVVLVVLIGTGTAIQLSPGILWLIPITVFLLGCSQSLTALSNREKKFRSISAAKVVLGAAWVGVNLILGVLGVSAFGLAVGYTIGQLFSVWYLYRINLPEFRLIRFNLRIFKRNILRNKNFAFIFLPAHLLNTLASNGPAFFLSFMFGLDANGYYFKAARVGESPTMIIRSSLGNVFWQQASYEYLENGSARRPMLIFMLKLFLIGVLPYTLAYFFAEDLFVLLFGKVWAQAATYFQILAPYFFIQFLIAPVTVMVVLANKPWIDIAWQVLFSLSLVISFYVGWILHDPIPALHLYTISMSVMQMIALALNYYYSIKR